MVREQSAIPSELQERKHGVRVAIIPDIELQRTAVFVLAVNAQIPSEQPRSRFPTQTKIGPAERIRVADRGLREGVLMRLMAQHEARS